MNFIGSTLEVSGVYPRLDRIDFGPYEVTPERGPDDFEFIAAGGIDEIWDVTRDRIKIEFTETITASSGEYNAWLIRDLGNTLQDFERVKIVENKTTAPWDNTMIEWTGTDLIINYVKDGRGVSVQDGQTLTLRVFFDETSGSNRNDDINGTMMADRLSGLRGRDDIDGRGGRDIINGGRGNDELNGGGARDRFVFKGKSGDDIVEDFQDGRDRFVIKDWQVSAFEDLTVDAVSGGVLVSDGSSSFLIENVTLAAVDVADFIFA